jgi:hypothetical protein
LLGTCLDYVTRRFNESSVGSQRVGVAAPSLKSRLTRSPDSNQQDEAVKPNFKTFPYFQVLTRPLVATLSLIFDSGGNSLNGTPVLIASRDIPDLTDEVIAKVQAQ